MSWSQEFSIILILAPILFPVAMKLGIDPIHFGVLITYVPIISLWPPRLLGY